MKQDLLNVVTTDALIGDEIIDFKRLNNLYLEIVTNQVGELTASVTVDGSVSGNTRLTDNFTELDVAKNEKFNDYINNTIGLPLGNTTGGSGNHAEGINNNLWNDFSSKATHVEGIDNIFIANAQFLFNEQPTNASDAESRGINWQLYKTDGIHIEGLENYSLYTNTNHIEGSKNISINSNYPHNEGYNNLAIGNYSHIEGHSDNTIVSDLDITDDVFDAAEKIYTSIEPYINNTSDYNNPTYDNIISADPYMFIAGRRVNLKNAVANTYLSYRYNYDVQPNFEISPNSKGAVFSEAGHTEGENNTSFGKTSHSEGKFTSTSADYSHSEGLYSHAFSKGAHVEGGYNIAGSFAILNSEGKDVTRSSDNSYSPSWDESENIIHQITKLTNFNNNTSTRLIFDEASINSNQLPTQNTEYTIRTGFETTGGSGAGYINQNYTDQSLSALSFTNVIDRVGGVKGYQHAEGYNNIAFGDLTHSEGIRNWAITPGSHVEGTDNLVTYYNVPTSNNQVDFFGTHVEGNSNVVYGYGPLHIEGSEHLIDLQNGTSYSSHIEGYQNVLVDKLNSTNKSSKAVHVEGRFNVGAGDVAHVEGTAFILSDKVTVNGDYINYYYENYDKSGNYSATNRWAPGQWGPKVLWAIVRNGETINLPSTSTHGSTFTNENYYYPNTNYGTNTHIEGSGNVFESGTNCHIEGKPYSYVTESSVTTYESVYRYSTQFHNVSGDNLHIEGRGHNGGGTTCHIEGDKNGFGGTGIHVEGYGCGGYGNYSHAEGVKTSATNPATHAEGYGSAAYAYAAHAEGSAISKNDSHTKYIISGIISDSSTTGNIQVSDSPYKTLRQLINETVPDGTKDSMSEYYNVSGANTMATGRAAHAEGVGTQAYGDASHSQGLLTQTGGGVACCAEGISTRSSGDGSHAEGIATNATGIASHAEGIGYTNKSSASATASHAEGAYTQATGMYSHAEGSGTESRGISSHTEGSATLAIGNCSHAGGYVCTTTENFSFAHGTYLNTEYENQFVIGKYNAPKASGDTNRLFVIGNGTADDSRSNALTVDVNGKLTTNDIAFGTINSLTTEIANIWAAIGGGGGGGGVTTLAQLTDVDINNMSDGQVLVYNATSQKWVNSNMTSLTNLTDVDISNPTNGQTLIYNSTTQKWENGSGGGSGSVSTLDDLTDVTITNPTNNQALLYKSSLQQWVNDTIDSGDYILNVIDSGDGKPGRTSTINILDSGSYKLFVSAINSEASTFDLNINVELNNVAVTGTLLHYNAYNSSTSADNRRNNRLMVYDINGSNGDTVEIDVANVGQHTVFVYALISTDGLIGTVGKVLSKADSNTTGTYSQNAIVIYGITNNNVDGTINVEKYVAENTITTASPITSYGSSYIYWIDVS